MKKFIVLGAAVLFFSAAFAQEKKNFSHVNVGLGFGIDYGGLGGRLTLLPAKSVFLFGGLGYNLNDLGYNVGGGVKIPSKEQYQIYLIAMYGYNAVLIVTNASENNETYYGPSAGAGCEVQLKRGSHNFFNFELLLPFRPSEFKDDIDRLENSGAVFTRKPIPVAISLGIHFGL